MSDHPGRMVASRPFKAVASNTTFKVLESRRARFYRVVRRTSIEAPGMEIRRSGSQPSTKGPESWFTGTVRIDPLMRAAGPARVSTAYVTVEPRARTAWHTHPLGQTLIVTAGCGWVQCEGGPPEEIRPGDVIWTAPGEKHWHGAKAKIAMTHIAVTEALNGKNVDWLDKVGEEQFPAF